MNSQGMTPTKWKCDAFLESHGLHNDFAWLADNVGMGVFSNFHYLTYCGITVKFLSTFEHTLEDSIVPVSSSFTLGGVLHTMMLEQWCNVFGFENRGVLDTRGFPIADALGTWDLISIKDEHDLSAKKVSSIQNPAVRYFMIFLANTIFSRENIGGMLSYDMCMLHTALQPKYTPKPNLGAFLMLHLGRQHKKPRGTIVVGGIVTRLAEHFGLDIDEMPHVPGPTVLNRRIMTNTHFIGLVQGEHCYKCPYITLKLLMCACPCRKLLLFLRVICGCSPLVKLMSIGT